MESLGVPGLAGFEAEERFARLEWKVLAKGEVALRGAIATGCVVMGVGSEV